MWNVLCSLMVLTCWFAAERWIRFSDCCECLWVSVCECVCMWEGDGKRVFSVHGEYVRLARRTESYPTIHLCMDWPTSCSLKFALSRRIFELDLARWVCESIVRVLCQLFDKRQPQQRRRRRRIFPNFLNSFQLYLIIWIRILIVGQIPFNVFFFN